MAASIINKVSSTTAGGTANAVSLGGRPAGTAPSASNGLFFDDITTSQNDAQTPDYRCWFIYNNGTEDMENVTFSITNASGGATVTVALSSTATADHASYVTAVIASETTAPSVTGSYGASVTIGTLLVGQVKAVWLKRVPNKDVAKINDNIAWTLKGATTA